MVVARIFGRPRIYLVDPALIQDLLVRRADAVSKGLQTKRTLGPILGQGLLTADGAPWRWQRQSMAPTFQHARLKTFLPTMIAAAEAARDRWPAAGGMVDIGYEMMATTFQIIVETMLSGPSGMDIARVERSVTDYLRATNWMFVLAILKAPASTPHPGRRRAMAAAAYLRDAVTAMVGRRRASEARDDLVSLLLAARDPETGRGMNDAELTDNLLTFMTAGHETTALGLGWTFQLLARHPIVAQRVADEIEAVTAGGSVTPEHIDALVYTRQVFQEALRLYPPAPIIARTVETAMTLADLTIKAETVVVIPIYALHRHTALWQNPDAFDPDRFAPEAVKGRHRYAYMPFGGGPRVCIGNGFATMEGVAILAVLLKTFRLVETTEPLPDAIVRITLRPKVERPLRVAAR